MKTDFSQEWKDWITTNINAGQDPDGIFKILLDEGYAYAAIVKEMNHQPSRPSSEIVNPLTGRQTLTQVKKTVHPKNNGKGIKPSQIFIPNALSIETNKVDMRTVDNFLNADECERLIQLIKTKLRPSEISNFEVNKDFRTSRTCDLGQIGDDFIREIDDRICKLIGIHPDYAEVTQGQYYDVGQEFKAHTDYFEKSEFELHCSELGQRTYTVMIYLNDVEEGGETHFTKLNQEFKPVTGTAVIWNSLNPDGSPNKNTMHHAKPILKGHKAIITKWFRTNPSKGSNANMFSKSINEIVPNYTRDGIFKSQMPKDIFDKITKFYQENKSHIQKEHVEGGFIYSANTSKGTPDYSSSLIDLSPNLRQEVHDTLKPLMESWCEQELESTYVYGIREYHRDAILRPHRDRIATHIISAILNVDQHVDSDWPLIIEDNYYRSHTIFLKPGEMIFYEGARLQHGRPLAFDGDSFANIFCHFKPVDYIEPRSA